MLLVSNFINDKGVDEYTQNNIVKIPELEKWYYKRLMYVTKGTTYEYSKSVKKFSKCYYQDCCTNRENIGSCDKSGNFLKGDKFYKMLKGTTFENFLSVREGGNLSV
jgi:hypothetical protein